MMKARRVSTARKEAIVLAFLAATGGHPGKHLDKLLPAMRAMIGDVSAADVCKAVRWGLRQPLPGARAQAPRQPSQLLRTL
jgi:hypothetical protein